MDVYTFDIANRIKDILYEKTFSFLENFGHFLTYLKAETVSGYPGNCYWVPGS